MSDISATGFDDSDSSDSEDDQSPRRNHWAWLMLPVVCLVPSKRPWLPTRSRLLAHWSRFAWAVLFLVAYYISVDINQRSARLTSGEIQELRDEFFPDAGKASERLTEGEVTPGFKMAMHADDVAKTLTWFQMFCMHKAGSDDHIPWAWRCTIGSVDIGDTKLVPWNIVRDARRNGGTQNDRVAHRIQSHICGRAFISKHVMYGDNPSQVHFGDTEELNEMIAAEMQNEEDTQFKVAESFDEFTVLFGNPMMDIIEKAVQRVSDPLFKFIEKAAPKASKPKSDQKRKAYEDDREDMPTWCHRQYNNLNFVRILSRELQDFDTNNDFFLTENDFGKFIDKISSGVQSRAEKKIIFKRLDTDNDNLASYLEVIRYLNDNKYIADLVSFNFFDPACVNHHWGLLRMCGPEHINVKFHIENANDSPDMSKKHVFRNSYIDLTLKFQAIDGKQSSHVDGKQSSDLAATGWYRASIELEANSFHGQISAIRTCAGIVTLLLFVPLFLLEFAWTLLSLPRTLYQLLAPARRAAVTSLGEIALLVLTLNDGRRTRLAFMSASGIFLENAATLLFLVAVAQSVITSFVPSVPSFGTLSRECESLYEDRVIQNLERAFKKENGKHMTEFVDNSLLITPMEHLMYCDTERGTSLVALLFEFFFDATHLHGVAFFLFACRLLDISEAFSGTAWVNRTLRLAFLKLCNFFLLYFLIICIFGALMRISFGSYFVQFRSLQSSCIVLIFFSFGITEYAFQDVHTFEENQSWSVSVLLLIFSIMVVTVFLQVFVAIILDAYSVVADSESYAQAQADSFRDFFRTLAGLFFPKAVHDRKSYHKNFLRMDFRIWQFVQRRQSSGTHDDDEVGSRRSSHASTFMHSHFVRRTGSADQPETAAWER